MRWIWIAYRDKRPGLKGLLLCLLLAYLVYWLACYLPAVAQARQVEGTVFWLDGYAGEPQQHGSAWRVLVRQKNGVRLLLITAERPGAGDRVQGPVLARRPHEQRNPGGFSEAGWLAGQGVFLVVEPSGRVLRFLPAPTWSPVSLGATLRGTLRGTLAARLPEQPAALLAALLLGDTSGLSQTARTDFSSAGLSHLTAVSGLHLSCLLLPVNKLLRRCGLPAERRYSLLILLLVLFGLLTGWRTSVIRAVAMSVAALGGRLLLRQTRPLYSLGAAAVLLLLLNPFAVLSSGFWMTVGATAAVISCSDPLGRRLAAGLPWLPPGLSKAFAVVLAAQLGSLWWSARISGSVFLPGFFFNVPAGLLTGLVLWLGLALVPAALLSALPWLAWLPVDWLTWPLRQLLDLLAGLAAWLARLPFGRVPVSRINPVWQAGLILLLLWLLVSLGVLPCPPRSCWRWRHQAWRCLLLGGCLWACGCYLLRPPVQVWFLDVGQGDAILMVDRAGRSVLVDGGRTGQGLAVVQPALDALGIGRVDLAVATHAHDDHIGGLAELADYRRIGQLVLAEGLYTAARQAPGGHPDLDAASAGMPGLLQQAQSSGVKVQTVNPHDTIALGRHIRLAVLAPADDAVIRQGARQDGNAWSLILLARCGPATILLTADCTEAVEQRLAAAAAWPEADVLKVAHHGSGRTTGTEMLRQVKPQLAVITVGKNRYGHPAAAVLARLAESGSLVCRTDQHGAIRVDCRSDALRVRTLVHRVPP